MLCFIHAMPNQTKPNRARSTQLSCACFRAEGTAPSIIKEKKVRERDEEEGGEEEEEEEGVRGLLVIGTALLLMKCNGNGLKVSAAAGFSGEGADEALTLLSLSRGVK